MTPHDIFTTHFLKNFSVSQWIYESTYFRKLASSLNTALQPGQRQKPLANGSLDPSVTLHRTQDISSDIAVQLKVKHLFLQ